MLSRAQNKQPLFSLQAYEKACNDSSSCDKANNGPAAPAKMHIIWMKTIHIMTFYFLSLLCPRMRVFPCMYFVYAVNDLSLAKPGVPLVITGFWRGEVCETTPCHVLQRLSDYVLGNDKELYVNSALLSFLLILIWWICPWLHMKSRFAFMLNSVSRGPCCGRFSLDAIKHMDYNGLLLLSVLVCAAGLCCWAIL